MIFCGEFVRLLDGKWRFSLPKTFKEKVGDFVYFYLAEDLSVRIYPSTKDFTKKECSCAYDEKVDSQGRVMIPKEIRKKVSFYSSKIKLVGRKEYIEVKQVL